MPVDRAELTLLVGPLVPDADAALLEPAHVGVAAQEPQQLTDDRAQVQLLRREGREALRQVEAHLVAEDAPGARAGAVGLVHAVVPDVLEEVEVLTHGATIDATTDGYADRMTTSPFGRVVTAMVTPMTPDGAVDAQGVAAVVEHLIATGHDGVVVNGTTGESPTLSSAESIAMVETVKRAAGDRLG